MEKQVFYFLLSLSSHIQELSFRELILSMPKILLVHGPNLNLLGSREPEKYGTTTLSDIESNARNQVLEFDPQSQFFSFQHNHEGSIVDRIHEAKTQGVDFIVINAGAYTHTSVAIRDAILGVDIPFIELHITNVHAREEFRHKSFLADKAVAVISGLGPIYGYKAAVDFALNYKKK
jgi:3-dehydroquinate dehydratase-2